MAQLIKLYHYISRYEQDIYHYSSKFIRTKKEDWEKTDFTWEEPSPPLPPLIEDEERSLWSKWFSRKKKKLDPEEPEEIFQPVFLTEKEKRQQFLDSLFPFQLKWASSTDSQMSFLDNDYKTDKVLKYFLQRFPDTYLLFYQPVFSLKNTPMETDILLVGPFGIDIIKLMENNRRDVWYTATGERVWKEHTGREEKNIASPLLSLNRTEKVVKSIMRLYGNDFPVQKIVLSRTNEIEPATEPYRTSYVDKTHHEAWLERKRVNAHLLKHRQLRVCEILLSHCDRVAFRRPEWDQEDEDPENHF